MRRKFPGTKRGRPERDTRALNPDCGSALCVAHLPVPHVCVFIMSNSCLSLKHDQKCTHTHLIISVKYSFHKVCVVCGATKNMCFHHHLHKKKQKTAVSANKSAFPCWNTREWPDDTPTMKPRTNDRSSKTQVHRAQAFKLGDGEIAPWLH